MQRLLSNVSYSLGISNFLGTQFLWHFSNSHSSKLFHLLKKSFQMMDFGFYWSRYVILSEKHIDQYLKYVKCKLHSLFSLTQDFCLRFGTKTHFQLYTPRFLCCWYFDDLLHSLFLLIDFLIYKVLFKGLWIVLHSIGHWQMLIFYFFGTKVLACFEHFCWNIFKIVTIKGKIRVGIWSTNIDL